MKRLLICSAFTIYLFACNSGDDSKTEVSVDSTTAASGTSAAVATPAVLSWEINPDTANKMKNHLAGCKGKCTQSNIIDTNKAVLDSIKLTYPGATMNWIPARYRQADVTRYCTLRNFTSDTARCNIAGCRTWILQVVKHAATGGDTDMVVYFDFVIICPPPYDTDCPAPDLVESAKSAK